MLQLHIKNFQAPEAVEGVDEVRKAMTRAYKLEDYTLATELSDEKDTSQADKPLTITKAQARKMLAELEQEMEDSPELFEEDSPSTDASTNELLQSMGLGDEPVYDTAD